MMTKRKIWAPCAPPRIARIIQHASVACILLMASASPTEAVEPASSEQCSNPAFVLETFRADDLSTKVQSSLHVASDHIAKVSAQEISSSCGQYLTSFRGSSYRFSTGVVIGPNRASSGLEARSVGVPQGRTLSKIEDGGIYSSEERIAAARDGSSVDLFLSSSDGQSEVSIITKTSSGAANRLVLLNSETTIRSVGWIGSVHGDQGGLYVLEEGSRLVGHVYVLKVASALGEATP